MLIELQDLGKSFGEHEVLRGITASVEKGDRIGIIGANGTGKTTLLRILCSQSQPDTGSADFAAGATCGYLEQTAHLDASLTIYDTMKESFRPALDAMSRLETLQKQLAVTPDDPLRHRRDRALHRGDRRHGRLQHGHPDPQDAVRHGLSR